MAARGLFARLPLAGDPEVLRHRLSADPQAWLPAPARPRGVDRWTVDLAAGRFHRRVACRVGMVWVVGQALWRSVSWEPVDEPDEVVFVGRFLPTFDGKLLLTVDDGGAALVLEGTYAPPAGWFGAVADRAAFHTVADTTAMWFLRSVAARLGVESDLTPVS